MVNSKTNETEPLMDITRAEAEEYLQILADTPLRLAAASQGIEDARLSFKADQRSWSANDILAHLRACADVWGNCIQVMLAQEHPIIPYISPRTFIRKTDYPKQAFHSSLAAFTRQREELLRVLQAMDLDGWSRGGVLDDHHRLLEHTVFSTARRLAKHELEHCEQLESMLSG